MPNFQAIFETPISDAWIALPAAGQGINSEKLIHYFPVRVSVADPSTTVTAATKFAHCVGGTYGYLDAIDVIINGAPTNTYAVTIDVKRNRAGAGYVTVLSSVVSIVAGSSADSPIAAALEEAMQSCQAGDCFEIDITVSGSGSGAQATGLTVILWFEESET